MKQVSTPPLGVQILSVGFGPKLKGAIGVHVPCQVRSTLLASGARSTVTCPAGSKRRLGIRCKSAIVKSSTMKGAKALASECNQRRCRIAKRIERRVREELLCSAPGNHSELCPRVETTPRREPRTYARALGHNKP